MFPFSHTIQKSSRSFTALSFHEAVKGYALERLLTNTEPLLAGTSSLEMLLSHLNFCSPASMGADTNCWHPGPVFVLSARETPNMRNPSVSSGAPTPPCETSPLDWGLLKKWGIGSLMCEKFLFRLCFFLIPWQAEVEECSATARYLRWLENN